MSAKSSREERTYRRGVVMGLTMAEIMVLVIFALLLILARTLRTQEVEPPVANEDGSKTRPEVVRVAPEPVVPARLIALVESWHAHAPGGGGPNQFDDQARDLIAAADVGNAVALALRERAGSAGSPAVAAPTDEFVRRGADILATAIEADASLGANTMGLTSQQAVTEFLARAGEAFAAARNEDGHGSAVIWLIDIIKRAESTKGGRANGVDYPPCSATNGRPDLIYDVRLGSGTITVHDNRLPEVAGKSGEWPTSRISFDQPVSRQAFVDMTADLYAWSVARQCRFFVRVIDGTLPHEKTAYKVQLRTVEGHFYKTEAWDGGGGTE